VSRLRVWVGILDQAAEGQLGGRERAAHFVRHAPGGFPERLEALPFDLLPARPLQGGGQLPEGVPQPRSPGRMCGLMLRFRRIHVERHGEDVIPRRAQQVTEVERPHHL